MQGSEFFTCLFSIILLQMQINVIPVVFYVIIVINTCLCYHKQAETRNHTFSVDNML